MSAKNKDMFTDLGKATLRGVRKCPKCGTFNGTRGTACKNCKVIFKMSKERNCSECEVEAVKIMSGSPLQIFSVRVEKKNDHREMRCFVHLPLIEGIESIEDEAEVVLIMRSAATCYAAGCAKQIGETAGATVQLNFNPCVHTQMVVNCDVMGEPLHLEREVLHAMPLLEGVRDQICSLVTVGEHPVQRVNKNVLVVKCVADEHHPLGYLHFYVFEPSKAAKKFKVLCECQTQLTKPIVPREKQMCIHFYMCLCAFASDSRLLEEFKGLVEPVLLPKSTDPIDLNHLPELEMSDLREFFIDDIQTPSKRKKPLSSDLEILTALGKTSKNENLFAIFKNAPDSDTSLPFEHWLASVTERINQTMHYQCNGSPDPLVFQVPQPFFDALHKRLCVGFKKKRLPNSVVGFSRRDAPPIGVFTRYTWNFTNILHVKRIFDTQQVPLEVTRSFTQSSDGTYTPVQPPKKFEDKPCPVNRKIKPPEYKTFLKVGNTRSDQKSPTPFTIEWTPDVLPRTHVGELRIQFQYGHQKNGLAAEQRGEEEKT